MLKLMQKAGEGDAGGGVAGDEAAAAKAGADAEAAKAGDKGLLADHAAKGANGKGDEGAADKGGDDGRPADVPEQFWDKEKKSVNFTAWNKATNDTRQELKKLKGEPPKGIPKTAEEYAYEPPKDVPKYINTAPDDPAVKVLRKTAFDAGLTQDQFSKFINGYFAGIAAEIPAPADPAEERAKLGKNAEAVMDAVLGWGKGLISDGLWSQEEFDEVVIMGSTAAGLRALNKLRENYGGQPIPLNPGEGEAGAMSADELAALTTSEKYRNGDPAEVARVTKLFEKHYGTAPSGSSRPGVGVRAA